MYYHDTLSRFIPLIISNTEQAREATIEGANLLSFSIVHIPVNNILVGGA